MVIVSPDLLKALREKARGATFPAAYASFSALIEGKAPITRPP